MSLTGNSSLFAFLCEKERKFQPFSMNREGLLSVSRARIKSFSLSQSRLFSVSRSGPFSVSRSGDFSVSTVLKGRKLQYNLSLWVERRSSLTQWVALTFLCRQCNTFLSNSVRRTGEFLPFSVSRASRSGEVGSSAGGRCRSARNWSLRPWKDYFKM